MIAILALMLLLLALAVVASALWLAKPWRLPGASLGQRLRLTWVINSYDVWLSVAGTGGRRRRELREELLANLWDATVAVGPAAALDALGSPRALAAGQATPERARWARGLFAGVLAGELVVVVQVLATTVWADAAEAAGASRVTGTITVLPGTTAIYEKLPDGGISMGTNLGPLCLVVGLLVFLLVSRPWRARRKARPVAVA